MIKNKSILSAIYMIQDYRNGSHFLEETVDSVLNGLKLLDKELEALHSLRIVMGVNMNTKTHTLYHVQLVLETAIVIIMSQRRNEMTREEAKEFLLSKCKILNTYSWSDDRKAYDVPKYVLSDSKTLKLIDQIYNDHETAIEILMKANEEEISRHFNECEKYEAQLKAKDEEIESLKAKVYCLENDTIVLNMEQRLIDIALVLEGKLTSKEQQ